MFGYKWGYSLDLFSFKESDGLFFTIKIVTLILCIPWPLTLIPTMMSLAGEIREGTPYFQIILTRLLWTAVLIYPIAFFLIIKFAEKFVAPRMYLMGVMISLVPIITTAWLIYSIFLKVKK